MVTIVYIVYSQGFSLLIMPISIMRWRIEIGMSNPAHKTRFINLKSLRVVGLSSGFRLGIRFVFVFLILFACGDIELNLGPKKRSSYYNFSVFHWNLNSITAHNFEKVDLLQAYNTIHQYDMICLSESYLDESVSSDNDNLNINGYKLVRADHPGNVKRGGVCVYFKEYLPVKCLSNFYLKECLILKFLLTIKEAMLFHCIGHLVKRLTSLTHLSLI